MGRVGGKGDEDEDGASEQDSSCGGADMAEEKNHRRDGDDHGFDDVEGHGHGGAVALEESIGDPTGEEGAGHGDEGHQFQGPASGGRDIGFHVKTHLILKVEDSDLVRARANGPGAGIGSGIKPNEGMGEYRAERFQKRDGDASGVIDFISDDFREASLLGGRSGGEVHKEGGGGGEERRDTKEPAPFALRNGQSKKGKTGQDKRGEKADGNLAQLYHEAKDSGEGASFPASEPGRINFHHAGCAEGLKVAVHQPNEGEGGKGAGEGGKAENEVDGDGANGTDEEGGAAADSVGQEPVDELAGAVGERPDGQHVGDLGSGEVELGNHAWGGKTKVEAAHVVGAVEEADRDPV